MDKELLEIENLTIGFPTKSGIHTVVDHVNLEVGKGEIVGIVGESGSGKSMTSLAVMAASGDPEHDAQAVSVQHIVFSYIMVSHSFHSYSDIRKHRKTNRFADPFFCVPALYRLADLFILRLPEHP